MTKIILLDCDDVLLDWIGGFRKYMTVILGRPIIGTPDSWNMGEWLGIPDDEVMYHIKAHNSGPCFGMLEPVAGAVEAIEALAETAELHVITSCDSSEAVHNMRLANLQEFFPPVFSSLTCLDLGHPKTEALSKYKGESDVVWVEDNLKNAMMGVELGFRTYMRRTAHNTPQEADSARSITWFTNWSEINPERM